MKIFVAAFACVMSGICTSAQEAASDSKTLVQNNSHVVTFEIRGKRAVFTMEAIADFTNDRDPEQNWTNFDFAGIRVDANDNSVIDERIDLAFGTRAKTDLFCPQFLYRELSSSGCGQQHSAGRVKVMFDRSDFQETPHPIHVYSIPISELTTAGRTIGLVFRFHAAGSGYTHYPQENPRQYSFKETIKLVL